MATVFPVWRSLSVTSAPLIPASVLSITWPITVLVVGAFCFFAARPDAWSSQATASRPHRTRQQTRHGGQRLERAGNSERTRNNGVRALKLPSLLFFFLAR